MKIVKAVANNSNLTLKKTYAIATKEISNTVNVFVETARAYNTKGVDAWHPEMELTGENNKEDLQSNTKKLV
jgi:hypothetical protein